MWSVCKYWHRNGERLFSPSRIWLNIFLVWSCQNWNDKKLRDLSKNFYVETSSLSFVFRWNNVLTRHLSSEWLNHYSSSVHVYSTVTHYQHFTWISIIGEAPRLLLDPQNTRNYCRPAIEGSHSLLCNDGYSKLQVTRLRLISCIKLDDNLHNKKDLSIR